MDIKLDDLQKLIDLLKKNGITEFEGHGLKLKLLPSHQSNPVSPTETTNDAPAAPEDEDELLYWSS